MSEPTRTDSERLRWLIESGYLFVLRRFTDDTWAFELGDDECVVGPTAEAAIDMAMAVDEVDNAL